MKRGSSELVVGVFVLMVVAVLAFMTFRTSGLTFGEKEGYRLYTFFKNTAGLNEKSKIKIAGVDAGVLEKIELYKGRARLTLRMYPDVVVFSDATASIKAQGLLGDKYLSIDTGSSPPRLSQDDTIINTEGMADLNDLMRKVGDVAQSLSGAIEKLGGVLSDEEVQDSLINAIKDLDEITGNLNSAIVANDRKLQQTLDNVYDLTASLKLLVEQNSAGITNSVNNVEAMSASLRKDAPELLENLKAASADLKKLINESGPQINNAVASASKTMDSVNSIANKVDSGQGTLGKLVNDEELYTSVRNAAEGVNKTLDKVTKFRTFVQFQGDYLFEESDGKGEFLITLQPDPKKYYLIGVVTDPVGQVEETTIIQNGTRVTSQTIDDDLEFIAQFARRFDTGTALRIGITENTFGLGADQFFMDDDLQLKFDIWDFGSDEYLASSPHVRLGAKYFFYRPLYLTGGIDNIFNSDRRTGYTGLGVRFEDEDLKYLLSTLPLP